MNNKLNYKEIIKSKTNKDIPVLNNGTTVESRYDPEKEAERNILVNKDFNFLIVTGIGSGILIKKLSQANPEAFIIGLEESKEDLNFLEQIETNKENLKNKKIIYTEFSNLKEELIKNYIPSLYGNLKIVENQNWINYHKSEIEIFKNIINESLKNISADYSVQCHFGKIWQRNILNNIKNISFSKSKKADISKMAAIIGAGPTLDKTIKLLKTERNNYIIISTDTSLQVLLKNNIIPDFVFSIDSQNLSYNHFLLNYEKLKETQFYFDLTSDAVLIKKIFKKNKNINFFVSGHPFCDVVNNFLDNALIKLNAGGGTVTNAALDFAIQSGFRNIEIFGADFGFVENKCYAKGTYLDTLYTIKSSKLLSSEKNFSKLFFRTELFDYKNKKTTVVLQNYREMLEQFLKQNNCTFTLENEIYKIKNFNNPEKIQDQSFYSKKFCSRKEFSQYFISLNKENQLFALLPFIAYLRNKSKSNENIDFYSNIALTYFLSYN